MAPLIILLIWFGLISLVNKFVLKGKFTLSFVGRTSLAIMLIFTGIAHFIRTESMIQMLPDFIHFKKGNCLFNRYCWNVSFNRVTNSKTIKTNQYIINRISFCNITCQYLTKGAMGRNEETEFVSSPFSERVCSSILVTTIFPIWSLTSLKLP